MSGQLQHKITLVTGAASGIGRATALEAAKRGAQIAVVDINEADSLKVVEEIRAGGGIAEFFHVDLSTSAAIRDLMDRVDAKFGGIDILVNNAGISERSLVKPGQKTTIEELPEELFDLVTNINLKSVWLCSKYEIPLLRKRGGGSIINAGSIGGLTGHYGGAVYVCLKAAVMLLTKCLATELASDNIRANSYCPSPTETPFLKKIRASGPDPEAVLRRQIAPTLLKRLGNPEDVAKVICFLASDDASYVTGSVITVDGGTMAWRGIGDPIY